MPSETTQTDKLAPQDVFQSLISACLAAGEYPVALKICEQSLRADVINGIESPEKLLLKGLGLGISGKVDSAIQVLEAMQESAKPEASSAYGCLLLSIAQGPKHPSFEAKFAEGVGALVDLHNHEESSVQLAELEQQYAENDSMFQLEKYTLERAECLICDNRSIEAFAELNQMIEFPSNRYHLGLAYLLRAVNYHLMGSFQQERNDECWIARSLLYRGEDQKSVDLDFSFGHSRSEEQSTTATGTRMDPKKAQTIVDVLRGMTPEALAQIPLSMVDDFNRIATESMELRYRRLMNLVGNQSITKARVNKFLSDEFKAQAASSPSQDRLRIVAELVKYFDSRTDSPLILMEKPEHPECKLSRKFNGGKGREVFRLTVFGDEGTKETERHKLPELQFGRS